MALAALALGCSSGGESSGSDAASSVATSDRLLAKFDTGYGEVTFVEAKLPSGEFFVAVSETSPIGYGHVYSTDDYIDGWRALVEPPGWDDASISALKARMVDYPAGQP